MELKTSCAPIFSRLRYKLLLYHVCRSATLASPPPPLLLPQVRVTVLPSMTSPGGLTDTEGKRGASGGGDMNKVAD